MALLHWARTRHGLRTRVDMEFERRSAIGREALRRASEHLSLLVCQRGELRGVPGLRQQPESEGRAVSGEGDAAAGGGRGRARPGETSGEVLQLARQAVLRVMRVVAARRASPSRRPGLVASRWAARRSGQSAQLTRAGA